MNPNATRVHSIPAYPSARELPQGTDLAIVAIPRDGVLAAVDDCGAAGVRALVVVTAGFAEADAAGRALQQKLVEKARGLGMRIVGPNSMGLVNTDPDVRLNASVSPGLPPRGGVAMSSQSGALGLAMLALARQRHLGVSTFISVGNKADISGNDLLQYWQGDEATRVILLYLESFGNPRRFARIARGVSRSKPIVVVKPGRDAAGSRAAGPRLSGDAPVDALLRQTGVIRAETLDEMFDLAAALDRQPLPAGRRVAILSDGGGPGILCAGACQAARLSVPPLSDTTKKRLAAFLPPSTRIGNPLELVFSSSADPYARALETLLAADEVDAVIAIHTPFDSNSSAPMLEAIRRGVAGGARGGRPRQAGPGMPGGQGRRRHADGPRGREHADVRVPGIGRAGARKGGGVRRVARRPARGHSRFRRHRSRSARAICRGGDRGARSRLALGGGGQSGPCRHGPSRRSRVGSPAQPTRPLRPR